MPRPHTILQSDYPYNVGARCINRSWFSLPMDTVWNVMTDQLHFIHNAFDVRVHAFVLMSNHFHLIVRTPQSNLDQAMRWFMRETSRSLVKAGNRINQTYGGPHFRCILGSNHHYLNAYKYIYHNPVAAGVCQNVLDYPYSTLPGLLGKRRLVIPIEEDLTLFNDIEGTLSWLDRQPDPNHWKAMGSALRRSQFQLGRLNKRLHPLETERL